MMLKSLTVIAKEMRRAGLVTPKGVTSAGREETSAFEMVLLSPIQILTEGKNLYLKYLTIIYNQAFSAPRNRLGQALLQRLLQVSNNIFHVFDTHRQTAQVGGDAGGNELLVGQLTVGSGSGMENAGARVGNVDDQLCQL